MSFDKNLGQLLDGKQLNTIPPNASNDVQVAAINDMIYVLNNYNRDVVASGNSLLLTLPAGFTSDILVIPHNLGYRPHPYVYLPNATITDSDGVQRPGVNIPLPTYLNSGTSGGNLTFSSWLDYFVDTTNLYVQLRLATASGADTLIHVSYFLTRLPAA